MKRGRIRRRRTAKKNKGVVGKVGFKIQGAAGPQKSIPAGHRALNTTRSPHHTSIISKCIVCLVLLWVSWRMLLERQPRIPRPPRSGCPLPCMPMENDSPYSASFRFRSLRWRYAA